jgi:hypothetical protein
MLRSIKSSQRKIRIIILEVDGEEIKAGCLDEFQVTQTSAKNYSFNSSFAEVPSKLGAAADAAVTATSIDLTSATDGTLVIIGSDLASSSRI